MNNDLKNCPYCNGTGTKCVANGEDDYNLEICDCRAGELFEAKFNKEEAIYLDEQYAN